MSGNKSAPLAKAWIQLTPTLDGSQKAIEKQLGGVGASAGKSAGKGFKTGFLPIAGPIAGVLAGGLAVDFAKDAISQASDLNESMNALDVVFGKNAQGIKELGSAAAENLGLSNVDFNSLSVQFGGFVKTIAGTGGKKVVSTLDDLTTRAADFASVMNLEVSDAAQLFQSGLAGETEPLRRYGIDLSAAATETFAYANGIGKAGKALTESEKVQARYGLLMQETNQTAGDFTNTSTELANSQRILSAEWANAQAELGANLLPVMKDVTRWLVDDGLPALTGFIDDLKDPSTTIGGIAQDLSDLWTNIQPTLTGVFEKGAGWASEFLSGASGAIDAWKTGGTGGLADFWTNIADLGSGVTKDPLQGAVQVTTGVATSFAEGTFWEDFTQGWKDILDPTLNPQATHDDAVLLAGEIQSVLKSTQLDYGKAFYDKIVGASVSADPNANWTGDAPVVNVYVDTVVSSNTDDFIRKAQAEAKSNSTSGTRTTKPKGSTGKRVS